MSFLNILKKKKKISNISVEIISSYSEPHRISEACLLYESRSGGREPLRPPLPPSGESSRRGGCTAYHVLVRLGYWLGGYEKKMEL